MQPRLEGKNPVWAKGIAGAVLAVACAAAFWFGSVTNVRSSRGLWIDDKYLNIGDVFYEDKEYKVTLPVENRADEDHEIMGVSASCSCVAVSPRTVLIRRGQSENIHVTLDLSRLIRQSINGYQGFDVALSPSLRTKASSPPWRLRGRVLPVFTVDPPQLHFGKITRGASPPNLSFDLHASIPICNVQVKCDPSLAKINVATKESGWRVAVHLQRDLPSGWLPITVYFQGEDQKGKTYAGSYPVTGEVLEEIESVPEGVLLGALPVGDTANITVALRTRDGKGAIKGVQLGKGLSRVDFFALESARSETATLRIRVPIEKAGETRGQIFFRVFLEGHESPKYARLEVCYYGLSH